MFFSWVDCALQLFDVRLFLCRLFLCLDSRNSIGQWVGLHSSTVQQLAFWELCCMIHMVALCSSTHHPFTTEQAPAGYKGSRLPRDRRLFRKVIPCEK